MESENFREKSTNIYLLKKKIASDLNFFFTNKGKNLANKTLNVSTSFKYFVSKSDFVVESKALSVSDWKMLSIPWKELKVQDMTILATI